MVSPVTRGTQTKAELKIHWAACRITKIRAYRVFVPYSYWVVII